MDLHSPSSPPVTLTSFLFASCFSYLSLSFFSWYPSSFILSSSPYTFLIIFLFFHFLVLLFLAISSFFLWALSFILPSFYSFPQSIFSLLFLYLYILLLSPFFTSSHIPLIVLSLLSCIFFCLLFFLILLFFLLYLLQYTLYIIFLLIFVFFLIPLFLPFLFLCLLFFFVQCLGFYSKGLFEHHYGTYSLKFFETPFILVACYSSVYW